MGDGCPIMPTKGSRTAQSVAVDVEFREREARHLSRSRQWEEAEKIYQSISPEEHHAEHIASRGAGRSTYRRQDILIPRKEEKAGADNYPGNIPKPSL